MGYRKFLSFFFFFFSSLGRSVIEKKGLARRAVLDLPPSFPDKISQVALSSFRKKLVAFALSLPLSLTHSLGSTITSIESFSRRTKRSEANEVEERDRLLGLVNKCARIMDRTMVRPNGVPRDYPVVLLYDDASSMKLRRFFGFLRIRRAGPGTS